MNYHIWTLGCQMNVADSQLLASELERQGHCAATDPQEADILVVNTCVVRQSAEDKGLGRLLALRSVKQAAPNKVIGVMGCMVGVRDPAGPASATALRGCLHAALGSGADDPFSGSPCRGKRRAGAGT